MESDRPDVNTKAAMGPVLITAGILLVASVGLGAACLSAQGPLPGDVPITRLLQTTLGDAPAWAKWVTSTAKFPGVWYTLAVTTVLAFVRAGIWAVPMPGLALLLTHLADNFFRASFYAPKPIPDLVAVASNSSASGLPSTFALVYASLFGAVLLARGVRGILSTVIAVLCAGCIVVGGSARVILGGHWTSQIIASLLFAFAVLLVLKVGFQKTGLQAVPSGD